MFQLEQYKELHRLCSNDTFTIEEVKFEISILNEAKHANSPWNTKEWKSKRSQILKQECEKCASRKKLLLQHTPKSKPKIDDYIHCKSKEELLMFIEKVIDYRGLDKNVKTYCNKCAFHEDVSAGLIGRKRLTRRPKSVIIEL